MSETVTTPPERKAVIAASSAREESLGYMELLRAVPSEPDSPDPSDRVLTHIRPSVWDA